MDSQPKRNAIFFMQDSGMGGSVIQAPLAATGPGFPRALLSQYYVLWAALKFQISCVFACVCVCVCVCVVCVWVCVGVRACGCASLVVSAIVCRCSVQFCKDIWLMIDNAWLYNRKTSKVYRMCSRLFEVFNKFIDGAMRSLGFCCGMRVRQWSAVGVGGVGVCDFIKMAAGGHVVAARDQSNCLFVQRRHLVLSLDGIPMRKGTTVRAPRFFSSGKCHFSERAELGPSNLRTAHHVASDAKCRRNHHSPHHLARMIDRHRTPSATFSSITANTLEASHLDCSSRVGQLPEFPGTPRSQSPGRRPMAPLRASLELFPAEN